VLRALGDRPAGAALLEGTALEDDPLGGRVPVSTRVDAGRELSLLQTICRYGPAEPAEPVQLSVTVHEGQRLVFQAVPRYVFPAGDGVHCERLDRRLPQLPPGNYVARATLSLGDTEAVHQREFEVTVGPR
jgi:hypothetical protein